MRTAQWSKPFYGVQHLRVANPDEIQVTVVDYQRFALLQVFSLQRSPFTTGCKETIHKSASAARIAGEKVES